MPKRATEPQGTSPVFGVSRYLDAGAVAKLPVKDVVERVEAIPFPANQPDAIEATALLGMVPEPRITVTKALELYWTLARERDLRQERGPTGAAGKRRARRR